MLFDTDELAFYILPEDSRTDSIIKEIDPDAFITISKTASVFGKNFDNIKI